MSSTTATPRSEPGIVLEFRVLGPLEVSENGRQLDVGTGKQRALLAHLVLRAGSIVSTDRLIDALWGEHPPASALNSVHVYVSQLRKAIGDRRVETHGRGYRLVLEPDELDLDRFERLLAAGRSLLTADDPSAAAASLSAALELWRGQPLSDVGSDPFIQREIGRLEEMHLAALEERIEADLALGRHVELVPELEVLVREQPLRERLRGQLMLALYRCGRQADALDAYRQIRSMLSVELGLEPGRALQALEGAILRHDPELDLPRPTSRVLGRTGRRQRKWIVVGALLLLTLVVVTASIRFAGGGSDEPLVVVPNSLVRIDPHTAEPTLVVPIGDAPDIVIVSGGYVWVTHYVLRDTDIGGLRDAGDRTLTRVDPATGEATVVGGGLAPCGLAADPSGDVWVANCYVAAAGSGANVVRVDADTLAFETTWQVPGGAGFFRGLAYGGGFLWASDVRGGDTVPETFAIRQIDPSSGAQHSISLADPSGPLAWSEEHDDLWMSNFLFGSVSRLDAVTRRVETSPAGISGPGFLTPYGDDVWIPDWNAPQVARLHATGTTAGPPIELPVRREAGVWYTAAGAGSVWATTPRDGALWRIDPTTNHPTRIDIPYLPTGVAVGDDDAVWVTVRAR